MIGQVNSVHSVYVQISAHCCNCVQLQNKYVVHLTQTILDFLHWALFIKAKVANRGCWSCMGPRLINCWCIIKTSRVEQSDNYARFYCVCAKTFMHVLNTTRMLYQNFETVTHCSNYSRLNCIVPKLSRVESGAEQRSCTDGAQR